MNPHATRPANLMVSVENGRGAVFVSSTDTIPIGHTKPPPSRMNPVTDSVEHCSDVPVKVVKTDGA
jgi:hypothetical protein